MTSCFNTDTMPNFSKVNRAVERAFAEPGSGIARIPSHLCEIDLKGDVPAILNGSAGAVAAKYLCPKKEVVLGLIGAGHRAESQIEAISQEFVISRIRIWDPDEKQADAFSRKYSRYDITLCNPKQTCDCDLLVTTTPSRAPIVKARWIHPGTHINAMGAGIPGRQELDPTLLVLGKVFVDDRDQAFQYGEIAAPVAAGFFSPDRIAGTLGEVVRGTKGRSSDREITIFDSSGLGPSNPAAASPRREYGDRHPENR